uniref:Uncharacterized protein n=1 Tax=Parastrongyloides trichosuri TaxID=131310 RepID=A0A0N4ZMV1_PARTI
MTSNNNFGDDEKYIKIISANNFKKTFANSSKHEDLCSSNKINDQEKDQKIKRHSLQFGHYHRGLFYPDEEKKNSYGFYCKGQFKKYRHSLLEKNEDLGIFGYLRNGIFYVYEMPVEYITPNKYEFGYMKEGKFYSLKKYQENPNNFSISLKGSRCLEESQGTHFLNPNAIHF